MSFPCRQVRVLIARRAEEEEEEEEERRCSGT